MSNFSFLQEKWPFLVNIANQAEQYVFTDPNVSLIKIRQFIDVLVKRIFKEEGFPIIEEDNLNTRLKKIQFQNIIPIECIQLLHQLKKAGNLAVHEGFGSEQNALSALEILHGVCKRIGYIYLGLKFFDKGYIKPEKPQKEIIQKLENEFPALEKVEGIEIKQPSPSISEKEKIDRKERAQNVEELIPQTELETRVLIDEQLRQAGWEVDTEKLKYSHGARPEKGKNQAISEWPVQGGFVDYALFVGKILVGVIEAKKSAKDVVSDISQAKRYSKNFQASEDFEFLNGNFGEYKVPFLFATNGRPYLKQIETKSGIWFLDVRDNTNHPRALQAWYTPEGLFSLFNKDIKKSYKALEKEPFDYLTDSNGLNLYDFQVEVIKKVEEHIKKGNQTALVAMATGTGKTRTAIGLIYRFLKTKRFNRILFLVDRNSLGVQASDAFKDATIEDLLTFTQTYGITELKEKKPDINTKVQFATVQGLVKRLFYANENEEVLSIDTYDCICIDESHRGYILDKELSEEELLYKNQWDYISKYRQVIEYFDAVKIALTATPAKHTAEIFGKAVASYTYREAVTAGYLVDHDPPYIIKTKLNQDGIKWKKNEQINLFNPSQNIIETMQVTEDELAFDVTQFNKKVITEKFNRTVVNYLVTKLDPDGDEKTLIFCANNNHADLVVKLLKDAYSSVDDDAIIKITDAVDKPLEKIKRFKNERFPNIVVTVDLLTTGIDVPEICNIVFIRRVSSRILYEQMLGRATRLCPKIKKDHFNIYDAVGIYDVLKQYSQMQPVVQNPNTGIGQLIEEIEKIPSEDGQKKQVDAILGKIQRKLKTISKGNQEKFQTKSKGKSVSSFLNELKGKPLKEQIQFIKGNKELFEFFDTVLKDKERLLISNHEDELKEVERGYGRGEKPEDYINSFKEYVNKNKNKTDAWVAVFQRPQELTRQSLKELILELEEAGFTIRSLNTAYNQMTNEEMAESIIGFIRQQSLGTPLKSHEERVRDAIIKISKLRNFTKQQIGWLERIGKQIAKELIVDVHSFDSEPFKKEGGYNRLNKIFNNELDPLMKEFHKEVYYG